jgi:hypothetical protein
LFQHHKQFATPAKEASVAKLKKYLEFYKRSDLRGHCQLILSLESDLLLLLPSDKSKYYNTWKSQITKLIEFSKEYINKP